MNKYATAINLLKVNSKRFLPVRALVTLLAFMASEKSLATACTTMFPNIYMGLPATITINNTPNTPIGQSLTGWVGTLHSANVFRCSTNTLSYFNIMGVPGSTEYSFWDNGEWYHLYPTGVAGIGIGIGINHNGYAYAGLRDAQKRVLQGGSLSMWSFNHRAILVKTGPITGGSYSIPNKWIATIGEEIHTSPVATSKLWLNATRIVVSSPTCDLATTDANRTITLDTIRLSDFTSAIAGKKTFDLTANCSNNPSTVTFKFTGTPDPANTQLFKNTGGAANVGLYLYSRSGSTESIIGANGSNNTRTVSVSSNRAVLQLGAAYYRNGTPGKGSLQSTATVNITYN